MPTRPLTLADVREAEVYTPAEVAGLFKVERQTVANWCRDGILAAGKTPGGGYYRILGAEVLRAWGAMFMAAAVPAARRPAGPSAADEAVERIRRMRRPKAATR
jgi:hypothetical protein